jgi:hypothetical protein
MYQSLDASLSCVVGCNSKAELVSATRWYEARGSTADVTFVDLSDDDAATQVMICTVAGARLARATLHCKGASPPMPRVLPPGIVDDEAPAPNAPETKPLLMRLTLAKAFAASELFAKASKYPHCLPALLLELVLQPKNPCYESGPCVQ